jgi:esterase
MAKALFLDGRKSDYITTLYQSEINRLFPNFNVGFIDNAGLWIHADQPKAVVESFQAFFR